MTMLDYRMHTFLKLCECMNYRQTAQLLNMTQPAVTQQIQYLERFYGCKLFEYDKHVLNKTEHCKHLERKVRAALYMQQDFMQEVTKQELPPLKIGATKTIGEFVLLDDIIDYLTHTTENFTLVVDNTDVLLRQLDEGQLDFALIEGIFDKQAYDFICYRQESLVGVCAPQHAFAGKAVSWTEILQENLVIREAGSGTRTIFEDVLRHHSHYLNEFKRIICVNQFSIIKSVVASGIGITFAYESLIEKQEETLSTFYIKGTPIRGEFNYVYLKGTDVMKKLCHFKKEIIPL